MIPGADSHVRRHREAFAEFFAEQRSVLLPRVESGAELGDMDRWSRQLTAVILGQARRTVAAFGGEIAARFGAGFDMEQVANYLLAYSVNTAEATNATTAEALAEALEDPDPPARARHLFEVAIASRAAEMAVSKVTTEANFGRDEAARQAGVEEKRWVVTSRNPRASHARLDGESVPIGETFSNGAKWPGDPVLSLDERAGCSCLLDF